MSEFEITPPLFAILSGLIEERAGLCYTLQDRELLTSKLSPRALELGFASLLDYYYFLRYDPESEREFEALVNALVVNETFFFRELTPLTVMVTDFVAPRVRAGERPRIWCAACATGEEPLTLAMLLAEQGLLDRVELVASDISSSALARARSGEFSRRSLRHVPVPQLAEKWLTLHERHVSVAPALLQSIRWQQLNLIDAAAIEALGPMDWILCRNVLIYFRDETVARVVSLLSRQLRAGGALLVGVSESLLRFNAGLNCEEHGGVFTYRKAKA
ncbi:MAG TPA: protein-glutamate O-methyltransferase CheR [Polyangiaceae bacterium]|nr:protein-glutamate O-methyltransferase CheR [Polyangiaceae bacterium]